MLMPSSEKWGSGDQVGKYPVKIYTIDGVLIYQAELGGDNTDKYPLGGVIFQSSPASSMLDAIANPIIFYGGSPWTVINQGGHSGDLYNYYWTSYSRGTDGNTTNPLWHNAYLDGYIPLRVKSIYDPCPYLYRLSSNGTYNQFSMQSGWTYYSYLSGANWTMNTLGESWFLGFGRRDGGSSAFYYAGHAGFYRSSIVSGQTNGYILDFNSSKGSYLNRNDRPRSNGLSVRCIEEGLYRSGYSSTSKLTLSALDAEKYPKAPPVILDFGFCETSVI